MMANNQRPLNCPPPPILPDIGSPIGVHNMQLHSTALTCPHTAKDTTIRVYLATLPVTLTVILGPMISIAYHLTQPMDAAAGGLSLAQVVRGLLCAFMFLSLILSRGLGLLTHRFVRPLLFLATYALLTSLGKPYPYQHVVFAVKMAFVALIFANTWHLAERGLLSDRWLAACAWTLAMTMAACIGIGLVIGRTVDVYGSRYATTGLMNHVSVASVYIVSALPVMIRCMATSRVALAGMAIIYVSLFFTMHRSALIAAVVATCCSFVMNLSPFRGRIPWRKTLIPIAVLLLLAGIGLSTAAGADLMSRFKELSPHGGTGSGRYTFWRITVEHIMHRPMRAQLWGEGMGCIRDLLRQRYGLAIVSHNDGLDLIHALGVWGLLGIAWWYVELVRFAWSLRDHQQDGLFQGACTCVIILVLISVGTGGSFEPPWALCYAALGFWAGRTAYARQCRCTFQNHDPIQE
jgi:hypothetical protein